MRPRNNMDYSPRRIAASLSQVCLSELKASMIDGELGPEWSRLNGMSICQIVAAQSDTDSEQEY